MRLIDRNRQATSRSYQVDAEATRDFDCPRRTGDTILKLRVDFEGMPETTSPAAGNEDENTTANSAEPPPCFWLPAVADDGGQSCADAGKTVAAVNPTIEALGSGLCLRRSGRPLRRPLKFGSVAHAPRPPHGGGADATVR